MRGTRHTLTAHSPRVTRVQHAGEVAWGEVTASCYCCLGWVLIVPLRSPPPVCVYYRQSAAARRPGPRHPGSARRMRGARPGQLPRSLPPNFRGNYLYLGPRSCSSNHVTGGGLQRAVEGCRGRAPSHRITSRPTLRIHTRHSISKYLKSKYLLYLTGDVN